MRGPLASHPVSTCCIRSMFLIASEVNGNEEFE